MFIDPVIYCITNIINDKQYVGQAIIKAKRWKDHKSALSVGKHNNRYLQAAYNKYGKEAFIYTVLEILPTLLNLDEREQYWINKLNTVVPYGYNLNPIAGSARGFKHSIETKLKWSEQRKGKKRSVEFALNVSIQMKGKIVSDETKLKQSLAQTGSKKSEETKAKHALRMKGNSHNKGKKRTAPMSEETRQRISTAKKVGYAKRKAALDKA